MNENKRRTSIFKALCSFYVILILVFLSSQNLKTEAEPFYAKAECVMEMKSRRILYERNGETRLPMASTTKILTAITVLERCKNLTTPFTIPKEAIGVEGSSVYLKEGDKYSAIDLLYGLMLRSGNDAATALALNTSESLSKFSVQMNEIAKKAGALNSNFVNPHGLPVANHYTTARDLSYITCYAMHNSIFQKIVNTRFYEPCAWVNKNKLLKEYEPAVGVKTGYTKEAGRCLVSAANKNDMTLVCTVLSCADMYNRSKKLFEDCFQTYNMEKIFDKTDVFELLIGNQTVKATTNTEFYYPLSEGERAYIEIQTTPNSFTKSGINSYKKGENIGQIKIYLLKRLIFSGNLYKL